MPAFFLVLAVLGVVGALMVVAQRNPVVSALYLVLSFVSLAGMYVLLQAPFLAAVQVVVYAGAIMVLFTFVIMLLNLKHDIDDGLHHAARRVLGGIFAIALAAIFYVVIRKPWALGPGGADTAEAVAEVGNAEAVGYRLYTTYLFPFEVTSLVLLVGIIGAVVLAKRRADVVASAPSPRAPRAAAAPTSGARPAPTASGPSEIPVAPETQEGRP
jgi:NADH-quinone oxidoreductase subunit J